MGAPRKTLWGLLGLSLAAVCALGASCKGRAPSPGVSPEAPATRGPIRIFYVTDLDGFLEPCGCQSRPLGGIDRIAQVLERDRAAYPNRLVLAAGNLFFETPTVDPRMVWQERQKAVQLTRILGTLGLSAYAPGPADFALGSAVWQQLSGALSATALVSDTSASGSVVRTVGGVRVGVVGVTDRDGAGGDGGPASPVDPVAAARTAVAAARAGGAQTVVLLASVSRRVARTLAALDGVDFVIAARHEGNTAPPPERIGNAYLLTATNQGKSLGVVDLWMDDAAPWQDVSEATRSAELARLDGRIRELRRRLDTWRADPSADPNAVQAQSQRLDALLRERETRAAQSDAATGRRFAARAVEIDPDVPRLGAVQTEIGQYFRAVNEHNRAEYASLRPLPRRPRTRRATWAPRPAATATKRPTRCGSTRPARARVPHPRGRLEELQPLVRGLPRHGLPPAGRQRGGAERGAPRRAVRVVPRPRQRPRRGPGARRATRDDPAHRPSTATSARRSATRPSTPTTSTTTATCRGSSAPGTAARRVRQCPTPTRARRTSARPTPRRTDPPQSGTPRRARGTMAAMRPAHALFLAATLSACTATGVYRMPARGASARSLTQSPTAAAAVSDGADGPSEEGDASYYSDRLEGNTTANGERYDPEALTAAHRTLRFGTRVEVRRSNGARVIVCINDRGPFVSGRIIDLSRAAAEALGMIRAGVAPVAVRVLGHAGSRRCE
jgi:rare lipoprotein A (peptidoglycan hydrolase)